MAKARVSTNPMYTGGAGGYSFYVRDGEQVVRQRKNNSNYGESASRTQPQMERRVRWANLVNFYKAMSFWQPKAYETKAKGQTDYNVFMSLNINGSVVGLTKEMALNGCSVVENYNVSRGSLPSLQAVGNVVQNGWAWDIILSITIGSSTTVGQLSADIIDNNPDFRQGDNLAFIIFKNTKATNDFPYVSCVYSELTLNRNSSALLQSINLMDRLVKSSQNTLGATFGASGSKEAGGVLIHTRKVEGSLQVSSQKILTTNENIIDDFSSTQWIDECIASYGLDQDVPLDPSFRLGTITSVTADSVAISDGDTLYGQQTIRVYGNNLYAPNFKLIANNVVYTPLEYGEGYIEYSITANADIILQLNGRRYLSFRVEGIATPSELTGFVSAGMFQSGTPAEMIESTDGGCLNYAHLLTSEFVGFRITVEGSEAMPDMEAFSAVNGAVSRSSTSAGNNLVLNLGQIDRTKPCYMLYNEFIVFVGNYVV